MPYEPQDLFTSVDVEYDGQLCRLVYEPGYEQDLKDILQDIGEQPDGKAVHREGVTDDLRIYSITVTPEVARALLAKMNES